MIKKLNWINNKPPFGLESIIGEKVGIFGEQVLVGIGICFLLHLWD